MQAGYKSQPRTCPRKSITNEISSAGKQCRHLNVLLYKATRCVRLQHPATAGAALQEERTMVPFISSVHPSELQYRPSASSHSAVVSLVPNLTPHHFTFPFIHKHKNSIHEYTQTSHAYRFLLTPCSHPVSASHVTSLLHLRAKQRK